MNKPTALYIHIPFCQHICDYCDFPKLQYFRNFAINYIKSLKQELDSYGINRKLETIYIGGGTPTELEDDLFEELLKMVQPYTEGIIEYTIEANPESLSLDKLKLMKRYGVNRLSIVHPGDTVTNFDNPASEALPGYRIINPMVYCGLYPVDSKKYQDLKEALEKLTLNDASLHYVAETSQALGFGFRCGFLGLLHMDIVQERLEREYNLDLILTAPSVIYHVNLTDGTTLHLDNPSKLPDGSKISSIEEPYVKASIMTPKEYVGPIMELCQERRGIYNNMEYFDDTRMILTYELPLSEIVYNFFDKLKSYTKGYASFDYEFADYKKSDLVKIRFVFIL